MNNWMWIGMAVSSILGLVLTVLVVIGVVWLAQQIRADGGRARRGPRSALEELERRYARGEVDRETYLGIRADLEADGH